MRTYNFIPQGGTAIPCSTINQLTHAMAGAGIQRGSTQWDNHISNFNNIVGSSSSSSGNTSWEDWENYVSKWDNFFSTAGEGFDSLIDANIRLAEEWNKVDEAAAEFVKSIGLGAKGMAEMRTLAINFTEGLKLGTRFGLSSEETLKMIQSYDEELGRRVGVNGEGMEALAAEKTIFGDDTANKLATQLESFGVSLESSGKYASKMYADANKSGISLKKLSDSVVRNMSMANKYTFKDGLHGLERMAKKSLEIGMNMETVAHVAEQMMEGGVDKAVEMGAQLQVLGGSFAQFGNPLTMLSNGMLDMEGMQDQMAQMVKNFATFNETTGEMEISTFDKMRLRQAAKSMGVSYEDLVNPAMRQGIRGVIEKDINVTAPGMEDKTKELLMNTGVIKDGKAGANIGGQFHTVAEIAANSNLQAQLAQQDVSESDNIAQIATDVRSITKLVEGNRKQVGAKMASWQDKLGIGEHFKNNVARDYMSSDWYQSYMAIARQGQRGTEVSESANRFGKGMNLTDDPNLNFVGMAAGELFAGGVASGIKNIVWDGTNWYGEGSSPLSTMSFNPSDYTIKPTMVTTEQMQQNIPQSTYNEYYATNPYQYYPTQVNQNNEPIDLNINGSIRLNSTDGNVNFNDLMKDESFKRELTALVVKTMNEKNGVYTNY